MAEMGRQCISAAPMCAISKQLRIANAHAIRARAARVLPVCSGAPSLATNDA